MSALGYCSGLEDSWQYKIYFEDDRTLHAEHRGMSDIAGGNLQQLVGLQNLLFPSCSKVQEFPDYQIQFCQNLAPANQEYDRWKANICASGVERFSFANKSARSSSRFGVNNKKDGMEHPHFHNPHA
ncbi:hypothetical protein ACP70R_027835 [Stipagrostis hirtigluma subsp. patula]